MYLIPTYHLRKSFFEMHKNNETVSPFRIYLSLHDDDVKDGGGPTADIDGMQYTNRGGCPLLIVAKIVYYY